MSVCKFCQSPITWIKMGEKNVCLNPDGVSIHKCKDGIPQQGVPISAQIQQGTPSQYAPKVSYPVKGDDQERSNLILWQSCMKIAVEGIKMTGNFNDTDDAMAKRIAFVTDLLYEMSKTKARTGKIVPEIPTSAQVQINQMT